MPNNRVVYVFAARDRFSAVARRVASRVRRVENVGAKIGPVFSKAGRLGSLAFKSMAAAAGSLMAALLPLTAAAAAVAATFKFFTFGADFEDAMADLAAITGAGGKDLRFLGEESLRLSKVAKTSAAEVASAFKLVASGKSELLKDPRALSSVTEQALLLKNAAGIDLADAASTVVESLNQFGAGAEHANRFVNVLAAGAKIGAAEIFDISESLRNAGSVASITGADFETTNAAIQVLAKAGQKGAEAGTGLRGVMLKLNKAIPFEKVGGFSNALEILAEKNLSVAQLQAIFGEESIKAGAVLVKNVPLLRQWTRELTGTNEAQRQAEIRLATLRSRLRGVAATIGEVLLRTFERLGPTLSEQMARFERWADSIKPADVERFAGAVVRVAEAFVSIANSIAAIARFNVGARRVVSALTWASPVDLGRSLGERALRFFGVGESAPAGGPRAAPISSETRSRHDVNVNLAGPKGAIESVKTKTTGRSAGFNLGVNMAEEF